MFDIGFSELLVVGLVALIVIGPQRLPRVARTAGLLLGRLQRYVNDVKADINQQIELDELKKLQEDVEAQARGLEATVNDSMRAAQDGFREVAAPVGTAVDASARETLLAAPTDVGQEPLVVATRTSARDVEGVPDAPPVSKAPASAEADLEASGHAGEDVSTLNDPPPEQFELNLELPPAAPEPRSSADNVKD